MCCWWLFMNDGSGALPASFGTVHEPTWILAVMWSGPAYALVVSRSKSLQRAGESYA